MIEVGKTQKLTILRKKDFGIYLGDEEEDVLLPMKEVSRDWKEGDEVEVFVYRDSKGRKIATTRTPILRVGEIGLLEVVSVGEIGAFMKNGLERDVLLPFKEQTCKVKEGKSYPVCLYVDKSDRLCVTMRIYPYLQPAAKFVADEAFEGVVYEYKENLGAFVWIRDHVGGLIPKSELYQPVYVGTKVSGRILRVREDGKLDLAIRQKAHLQMQDDEAMLLTWMEKHGGRIPYSDKEASPEEIKRDFGLSKNAFKRAVGGLMKANQIEIGEHEIRLVNK